MTIIEGKFAKRSRKKFTPKEVRRPEVLALLDKACNERYDELFNGLEGQLDGHDRVQCAIDTLFEERLEDLGADWRNVYLSQGYIKIYSQKFGAPVYVAQNKVRAPDDEIVVFTEDELQRLKGMTDTELMVVYKGKLELKGELQ